MSELQILVGPPGAGKTTYAKYKIRTELNWFRLCRDDFRGMNFNQATMSSDHEKIISKQIDSCILQLIESGKNIIYDATNCKKQLIDDMVRKYNYLCDISFKVFDISEDELSERCEKRNQETGKFIPKKIQKKFFLEFTELKQTMSFDFLPKIIVSPYTPQPNLPEAIICDIDGTLLIMGNRSPYDTEKSYLDTPNDAVLKILKDTDLPILLVSGRKESDRSVTLDSLSKYKIPWSELHFRSDEDFRADSIVKKEIFEKEIRNRYNIKFVLDDRNSVVDMWRRELGLKCLQVNYGNF